MAGHSKWKNIKHYKAATDAKREGSEPGLAHSIDPVVVCLGDVADLPGGREDALELGELRGVVRNAGSEGIGKRVRVSCEAGRARVGGFGLTGMRERVALAGGELDIQTAPGGTSVRARLPARRPAAN